MTSNTLVKITMKGELAELFPDIPELDIVTPVEAIRAIGVQYPEFIKYLNDSGDKGIIFQLITIDHPEGLEEVDLEYPIKEELIIIPAIQGEGGSPLVRGLLGIALIGAAFFTGGISIAGLSISATTMGLLGGALILSGVSQLLAPDPQKEKSAKEKKSNIIDRAGDVTNQGRVVPVCYGDFTLYDPIVISSGIVSETMSDMSEGELLNPLYKRATQIPVGYKAIPADNYTYQYNPRTLRNYGVEYLSNRDPYVGCVVMKEPFRRMAIEIRFTSTASGLSVAAAYPLQVIRVFSGVEGYEGANRMEIYAGSFKTGLAGLAAFPLTSGHYAEYQVGALPQFHTAYPVFTFVFYNDNPHNEYVAIGEIDLLASIGLEENLSQIIFS